MCMCKCRQYVNVCVYAYVYVSLPALWMWCGVGGEVAIPVLREPWNLRNPCSLPAQAALFSTRKCSSLEPAKWRSGNSELCEHVMYNMQTVMYALCRHVPLKVIYKQTQIFFVPEHAAIFTQEALSLCSAVKRVRRPKSKLQAGSCCLAENSAH